MMGRSFFFFAFNADFIRINSVLRSFSASPVYNIFILPFLCQSLAEKSALCCFFSVQNSNTKFCYLEFCYSKYNKDAANAINQFKYL